MVNAYNTQSGIKFPEIDPVLLVLSGISQAGFIAGKVAMPKATETDAQISD